MAELAPQTLDLTDDQREIQAFAREFARTEIRPVSAGVGDDTAAMTTTAVCSGDEYVLNGQKTWISNGGIAEYYAIFATVAPGTDSSGVTAFVVEMSDPGIGFGEPMRKMG